jgi:hypothetical protein
MLKQFELKDKETENANVVKKEKVIGNEQQKIS